MQQISPKTPEFQAIRRAFLGEKVPSRERPQEPKAPTFESGQWVVTKKGELGMIHCPRGIGYVLTFGASGPTRYYSAKELRWATLQEVLDDGKHGIGYTPSPVCP